MANRQMAYYYGVLSVRCRGDGDAVGQGGAVSSAGRFDVGREELACVCADYELPGIVGGADAADVDCEPVFKVRQ